MKKWIRGIIVCLLGVTVLGGCQTMPKITKEQQDNIAQRIIRGYNVDSIEFINFSQNESTGTYLLSIKINKDESKKATMLLNDMNVLDKNKGVIALNPIEMFENLKRQEPLNDDETIKLLDVTIKYIGDR